MSVVHKILSSRMLVFRSKLLLLNCAQSRFEYTHSADDLAAIERLRTEIHGVEYRFNATELKVARDQDANLPWLYRSLIDAAKLTIATLNRRRRVLEGADMFALATDTQMLEELIAKWSEALGESGAAYPGSLTPAFDRAAAPARRSDVTSWRP